MARALRHEWHSLLYDPDVGLSIAAKVVGGVLIEHANRNGVAWPSLPRLRECAGLASDHTVLKGLRELERVGLLVIERRVGHVNRYQLVLPELTTARGAGVSPALTPAPTPAITPALSAVEPGNQGTKEPGEPGRADAHPPDELNRARQQRSSRRGHGVTDADIDALAARMPDEEAQP